MKSNFKNVLLIFVLLLIFIKTDYRLESEFYCCKDDYDYYAHAETIAIDFDFDYSNQLKGNENSRFFYQGKSAPTGFFGSGLLSSPFVFIGNALNRLINNNELFNFIILFYSFSSIFYLFFTLLLLNRINCLLGSKYKPNFLYLLLLGSGVSYFAFERYSMTHIYEVFTITLLVYLVLKFMYIESNLYASLIPLSLLLCFMTRWVNYYILLLPFIIFLYFGKNIKNLLTNKSFWLFTFISILLFGIHSFKIYGVVTFNPEFVYGATGSLNNFLNSNSNLTNLLFSNFKNLLVILFSTEFGLFWFSPIIFFGFYKSAKNLFLFNKKKLNRISNTLTFICYVQVFALILIWKSTASSYGFRYAFSLSIISILFVLSLNNLTKIEYFYLKYMSLFSFVSTLFFETTTKTQLSLEYVVNSFGVEMRYSQPKYLTGYIESLFNFESYVKIFAQSLFGLIIFSIVIKLTDIETFNQFLSKFSQMVHNSDLQTLFLKTDQIEIYKILVCLFLVFIISYLLVIFTENKKTIPIEFIKK